ncbi:MAG: hypothetical protein ACI841_001564 [Planctomycetota bacterium]|jgi:hypothetical protein
MAGDEKLKRGSPRKGFLLRLPPPVLDELRAWAAQDLRSLNGQIEFLLRDALKRRKGGAGQPSQAPESPEDDPESSTQ